jgi:hypothetical protein
MFESVRRHDARHSRCSLIHPIGDHNHRSYILKNQESAIRMAWSSGFLGSTIGSAHLIRCKKRTAH